MGDDRPLRPGTRRIGRNTYHTSTKFREEDRERLGEEEFNRRESYYVPKNKMKYGGMKKKTKKMKTGGMSKARGTGCAIRGTNFKGIF